MAMSQTHVIVGSGIAGLSAAETLRERDPGARILLVSEEAHDFYSRPGLAYYLRRDVPEKQLFIRSAADLRTLAIERLIGRVDQLWTERHELALTSGTRIAYDRLLLATGALATPPPFPGNELAGIVKLDGLDDTRHILRLIQKRKNAVVVGGGITALEIAEGLNARGMKVHYFLRGKRYWGDVLDETESEIIMERLRHEGIDLRLETQVKQALGQGGRLTGVETQAGEFIPCVVLGVAIGVKPRVELARQAGLKVEKGIVVDTRLRTSAADVFAAGDAAEVIDPRTGRSTLDVLWPTALAQGKVAGANMAGGNEEYIKGIPFNVTMLTNLRVTIIGAVGSSKSDDPITITRGESEAWRVLRRSWTISGHDEVNRVRLVIGERTLEGAVVMGDQSWSRPLQRLICERADISSIRTALIGGGIAAMAELASFYERWERPPVPGRFVASPVRGR
jgi:NADPH-dependent 2,4-dienoyl-CoA reductase/sulfur reductase-like enzyme